MTDMLIEGFDLDELFVDPAIADSGVWVDFYGGSRLKLGSTESKHYKSLMAKLAKKHRVALDDSNSESFELVQEITAEALATAVLKDWSGINIGGQKNAPYTPMLGKMAILRSAKFREFVNEKAGDPSLFRGTSAGPEPVTVTPVESPFVQPAQPALQAVAPAAA